MNWLINLLVNGLTVLITSFLLPGVEVSGFISAVWVAIFLGLINTFVKPILIVLTLPINILSLGLFTIIINALVVLITSAIVPGFRVKGIIWAILFSLVVSFVSGLLRKLLPT